VSERGKDLLISTIRKFIVLTLYFEVALNMTRVILRQSGKEIQKVLIFQASFETPGHSGFS